MLSLHGEHAFEVSESHLDPGSREHREWRSTLERDGILYISADTYVGGAFPDFYHTAFHAPWYVFEHWGRWFDVLAYLPRSSLDFQDQVVLRRRDSTEERATPLRARSTGPVAPAPAPTSSTPAADGLLSMPTTPSRFGSAGLLARRALFRVARPVISAQHEVDRSLADAVSSLDARVEDRMPPLVHIALRQQAERIERLESDLRDMRGTSDR